MHLVLRARGKEQLDATAQRLREQYGVDVIPVAADLADYEKTEIALSSITAEIGLLVYNAAFAPIGLFEAASPEQLALAAAVNVKAPLLLAKRLSARMIQNKTGGILLMSSLAGTQGSPGLAAYAATKAFNAVLAEGLWHELRAHNIDVTACVAGAITTPGYQQAGKNKTAPGTLPAARVAEDSLNALGKGPIAVPGAFNKFARFLMARLLPRRLAISIMAKNTRGLSS
jgi:short-subunit dehydrogenase